MKNGMSVTPEMLEKIDKAHAVSVGIMNNFKAQEPVAAALAKFNPVSQESSTTNKTSTTTNSASGNSKKSSGAKNNKVK